jgi:hypothetical protein
MGSSINIYKSKPDNTAVIDLRLELYMNETSRSVARIFVTSDNLKKIKKPFIFILKLNKKEVLKRTIYKFQSATNKLCFEIPLESVKASKPLNKFNKKIKFLIFKLY